MKILWVCALAMVLAMPMAAFAQGDARFSGTVLDQNRRVRSRRDGHSQEPEDRRRADGHDDLAGPVRRLEPEAVGLYDPRDVRQLPAARVPT